MNRVDPTLAELLAFALLVEESDAVTDRADTDSRPSNLLSRIVPHYEIGLTYTCGTGTYICAAVDPTVLITYTGGTFVEKRPYTLYPKSSISVFDLEDEWGIPAEDIDKKIESFFIMPEHVRTCPRGHQTSILQEGNEEWLKFRTCKIGLD